jgi:hypothetical protein
MTTDGLLRKLTDFKVSCCLKGEKRRNKGYEELKSIQVDVVTECHFGFNDDKRAVKETHILEGSELIQ